MLEYDELEERKEEAMSKVGDWLSVAFVLELREWLREIQDDLVAAVKEGTREGVSEAVEAVLERHPELLAIRRN